MQIPILCVYFKKKFNAEILTKYDEGAKTFKLHIKDTIFQIRLQIINN